LAIAAVNNNPSIFSRILPFKSKDVAAPAQTKATNADGDTLKLSSNTPNEVSKTAVYTQPKPVNPLKTTANADIKKAPAAVK
jgi:hypothetical protein